MSQHNRNTQSGSLNLGVKCGIEFDERVELLSSIVILSEICVVKTKRKKNFHIEKKSGINCLGSF